MFGGGVDHEKLVDITPAMVAALNEKRRKADKPAVKQVDAKTIELDNGYFAGYEAYVHPKTGKAYNRFVILGAPFAKGSEGAKAHMKSLRSKRSQKKLSPEAATRAFNRYYRGRDYAGEGTRKAAMTRDAHYSSKVVTDTTRYLRNPGKLDYPGLDAGPKVPSRRGKDAPFASAAALRSWREAHPKGSYKLSRRSGKQVRKSIKSKKSPEERRASYEKHRSSFSERMKPYRKEAAKKAAATRAAKKAMKGGDWDEESDDEVQEGGRAVSLKTAVRLLRNYYSSKYGRDE